MVLQNSLVHAVGRAECLSIKLSSDDLAVVFSLSYCHLCSVLGKMTFT